MCSPSATSHCCRESHRRTYLSLKIQVNVIYTLLCGHTNGAKHTCENYGVCAHTHVSENNFKVLLFRRLMCLSVFPQEIQPGYHHKAVLGRKVSPCLCVFSVPLPSRVFRPVIPLQQQIEHSSTHLRTECMTQDWMFWKSHRQADMGTHKIWVTFNTVWPYSHPIFPPFFLAFLCLLVISHFKYFCSQFASISLKSSGLHSGK